MDGLISKIVADVMNQRNPKTIVSKQVNVDSSIERPNYQKQKAQQRINQLTGSNQSGLPANERYVDKGAYQSGNVGPIKTGYGSASVSSEPNHQGIKSSNYQWGNVTTNLQLMGYHQTTGNFAAQKQEITSDPQEFVDNTNDSGFEKKVVQTMKHGVAGKKLRGTGELLGVAKGSTVGYVIPNLDPALREQFKLDPEIRAIGILSSRFGSAPQIMAADEAVKKTNSRILSIQLSRDGKENFGHGVFILLGSEEVAEVTDAVEIALKATDDFYNGIYEAQNGRLEVHFTARAAEALNFAFQAPLHQAFGIIIGSPAGIGLIMSDVALKTARVDVTHFWGPSTESAFANEVWIMITGDSAAVKNALEAAAQVGQEMIREL